MNWETIKPDYLGLGLTQVGGSVRDVESNLDSWLSTNRYGGLETLNGLARLS